MGTNYYLRKGICKECEHPKEELHIGKSSCGWTFIFQAHDEPFIHSANDWKNELPKGRIFDEYGEEISEDDFWKMVKDKEKAKHDLAEDYSDENDWLDSEGNSFTRREFS
uniref:Uncharacterized protein n=1 Tax=viral metagenome TaxID=1070528 RepID=A0A6M3XVU4_9ZZZZ